MLDEPRRHRRYMLILGLAALATVPLPFVGAETRIVWGLPLWLWWSFTATAVFAGVTAWGILRLWRDGGGG